MNRKILILGAGGMLGKELACVFASKKLVLWDKEDIDITRSIEVEEKISKIRPSLIINAAAFTNVDACETQQELARAVNGQAVGYIAREALRAGAALVHYSTDYVFDGANPAGYAEDAVAREPVNAYGASKLLGEEKLREAVEQGLKAYLVRTSWLFGKHGKNFISTMLALAENKKEIAVVNDQHGKPTYAKDLADATLELVAGLHMPGTYHIVNEPVTTWYDFARAIFDAYTQLHPEFRKPAVISCSSAAYKTAARRPMHSALRNTKVPPLRPWKEALRAYLE